MLGTLNTFAVVELELSIDFMLKISLIVCLIDRYCRKVTEQDLIERFGPRRRYVDIFLGLHVIHLGADILKFCSNGKYGNVVSVILNAVDIKIRRIYYTQPEKYILKIFQKLILLIFHHDHPIKMC